MNDERVNSSLLAAVRILLGLLWLQNVGWKIPPDFAAVETFVTRGIEDPTFPPYTWVLEQIIQPALTPFGWSVLVAELVVAVGLLFGLATRFSAVLGIVQSLAIGLTVARVPNEWGWSYWLLIAAHVAVFATPQSGRWAGLDGTVRRLVDSSDSAGRGWRGLYLRWAS